MRLPYDPEGTSIWKYYDNIRVYPVLMDNMLVILLTIPILDTTLELNIYRVHNLPAIPPGHQLAVTYQLEGEYFTMGKHPPLQIIYVGNGCEGFSSSVFIPAKSDQAVIKEIEPR